MTNFNKASGRWNTIWVSSGGVKGPARGGLQAALPSVPEHGISGTLGLRDELIAFGSIVVLAVLLGLLLYLGRGRKKE